MAARRPHHAWRGGAAAACVCLTIASTARAADDPLVRARQLYNQQQFEAAIQAADQARVVPARADAADLVAARAYLERFRNSAASDDLTNARERLRRLNPDRFGSRERADYLVGLGEALYFDEAFGAAARLFDSVLHGGELIGGPARAQVVDWWATSLDRDTRPRPEIDRRVIYERMRARLQEELADHPSSGAAIYWLAAVARAQGDLEGAWDAALAGWVRAPLVSDHGEALRADLDRLMERAIVPERAKALAQPPETFQSEWDRFKARWTR